LIWINSKDAAWRKFESNGPINFQAITVRNAPEFRIRIECFRMAISNNPQSRLFPAGSARRRRFARAATDGTIRSGQSR
jgi:hypothetical protein